MKKSLKTELKSLNRNAGTEKLEIESLIDCLAIERLNRVDRKLIKDVIDR